METTSSAISPSPDLDGGTEGDLGVRVAAQTSLATPVVLAALTLSLAFLHPAIAVFFETFELLLDASDVFFSGLLLLGNCLLDPLVDLVEALVGFEPALVRAARGAGRSPCTRCSSS